MFREKTMKKIALAMVATSMLAAPALAADVKIGVLLGFTGPIESLTPNMAASAEMAMSEASASGNFLGGSTITPVRADSTCVDAAAATAAAERLITSDGIAAMMGADCSGVTTAVLQSVATAKGIVMISPSATSPSLSDIADDGLFFRTAPSDARGGQVMAQVMMDRGIKSVALTYTNNDYGKGLADAVQNNFESMGGKVTVVAAHEDDKGDYSAEVAALAQGGSEHLVIVGYLDRGGKGIMQASLDSGAFENFIMSDGMIGPALPAAIGPDLDGSWGLLPGGASEGFTIFEKMAGDAGMEATPYTAESYDAAALIILAMQAAGSSDSQTFKSKVMDVANAPGTKIHPGELGKALKILADGGQVDYVGAREIELVGAGENGGAYLEQDVKGGKFVTVKAH
jgi:branched-chain amino acid transport system substrate-binding protein